MKPVILKEGQEFIIGTGVFTYKMNVDGKSFEMTLVRKVDSKPSPNLSAKFEELWKIHAKGNKKTAMQRYEKVVRKVSHEILLSKLSEYVLSNEFVFLKGLDVFLNPEKEHWNDPIVYKDGCKPEDKTNNVSNGMNGVVF